MQWKKWNSPSGKGPIPLRNCQKWEKAWDTHSKDRLATVAAFVYQSKQLTPDFLNEPILAYFRGCINGRS